MQFPLLRRDRQNDRRFISGSDFHLTYLDIPAGRGRVRLQMKISSPEDLRPRSALAIEWQKLKLLPGVVPLADKVWRTVTCKDPRRSRRAGLEQFSVALRDWQGTVYVQTRDLPTLRSIPKGYALLCVRESLAFAYRHLRGRWPSDKDKQLWMYRMHRYTAMIVADEVAKLYLSDRKSEIGELEFLKEADPILQKRIKKCWGFQHSGKEVGITPRRLALALVDAKFKHVCPELLDATRQKGFADGQLWSCLMPPEKAKQVRALCPTPTVRELRRWSRSQIHESYAADWFLRWWAEIVRLPLTPFHMEIAGDETWPSYVWEALYS